MSRFEELQKDKKIEREHAFQMNKMRREKLSSLCFDMAKIICTGIVIGGITPMFTDKFSVIENLVPILCGGVVVSFLIILGITIINK